ncbi:hypothetical protein ASPVEDRAFT_85300 [Aspergillus versicolor CBS 583.65]|uniref:NADH:flavin oxidoreductase/NADH oxidase N-terminal domain-containing protein n=1 Tax=Aspergillus versicolor CBS 583.65 TaxID=1036611 RepID=A0A1L9PR06_ASPVE|nr:uncharacterized protein ASPVEDRAFT_85300 [Aspergillus versicolor CBS 583.65]OJJ03876.1 hypothetical protein ASPVEDRAFT_85300 [Aspergillus versicolor CBS 583.65]
MSKLFAPIRVGRMDLCNRLTMAPMTRLRADDAHVPLPMVTEYYAQRASTPGTLLIAEGTFISPQAGGMANVPGIYNDAQMTAWKEVTAAVHEKGCYIYLQLWALGRVARPDLLQAAGGFSVVSSSETIPPKRTAVPHALSEAEIEDWIKAYAQGARNAIAAGFDGVEIHAANGYLIDQFIQDTCNKRTDRWGGSVENRARFAVEVTRAVVDAVGADRTGIRFSPWSTFQGMRMDNPVPTFRYLAEQMRALNLAYTHLVESRISADEDVDATDKLDFFLSAYGNSSPVVVAGGYTSASAYDAVEVKYKGYDVMIGFGRPYVSNPDLPFRVQKGVPLVPYRRDSFYVPKEPCGYIDYQFSAEFEAARAVA